MSESHERKEKAKKLLAEEREQPLQWFYCSFATEDRFLGALFIQGCGIVDVSIRAHSRGLNPGGELMAIGLPDDAPMPEEKYRNRLLDKETLQAAVGSICRMDGTPA